MHDSGVAATGGRSGADAGAGSLAGSEGGKQSQGLLRRHWPSLRKLLILAFFAVVATMLVRYARNVDWASVLDTLRGFRPSALAAAAGLASASYLLYGSFDLLARCYAGHRLGRLRTLAVAMISYAFNLNLGAMVGGAGFRLRMYSRLGLEQPVIARVIAFSVMTNWLGYLCVAAVAFTLARLPLPEGWGIAGSTLPLIGVLAGLFVLAWMAMCLWSPRREIEPFGHRIELPSARMAAMQLFLASLNWLAIAAVIYLLLQRQVDYPTVLALALLGAIAGAVTHIPAGLGVLEAVFLAGLGEQLGHGPLLAALLAYRAIYYIGPLIVALVAYLALEAAGRRRSPERPEAPGGPP